MENRIIEFDLYYMYLNENMARSQNDKPSLFLNVYDIHSQLCIMNRYAGIY